MNAFEAGFPPVRGMVDADGRLISADRRLADLNRLEIALTGALEGSRIADRAVVLNIAKHLGRALGSDGRASSPDASPRYG